jgi:hypothetical protein
MLGFNFPRNGATPQQQRLQWYQLVGFMMIIVLITLDEVYRSKMAARQTTTHTVDTITRPKVLPPRPEELAVKENVNKLVSLKRALSNELFGHNVTGL